jgi:hypothetical protein
MYLLAATHERSGGEGPSGPSPHLENRILDTEEDRIEIDSDESEP